MNFTLTIEGQGVDALASLLGSFAGAGLTTQPTAAPAADTAAGPSLPAAEKPTAAKSRAAKAAAVTVGAPAEDAPTDAAPAAAAPVEQATPAPVTQELTVEAVRAATQKAAEAGKRDKIPALLKKYGASNVTSLPADKRADYLTDLEAA